MKALWLALLCAAPGWALAAGPTTPAEDFKEVVVSAYSTPQGSEPVLLDTFTYAIAPASEDGKWTTRQTAYVKAVKKNRQGTTIITPGVLVENKGGPAPSLSFQKENTYVKECSKDKTGKVTYTPGIYNEGIGGYAYRDTAGAIYVQVAYATLAEPLQHFAGPDCAIQLPKVSMTQFGQALSSPTGEIEQDFTVDGKSFKLRAQAR